MCVCVCVFEQGPDLRHRNVGALEQDKHGDVLFEQTPHEPLLVVADFTTSPNSYNVPQSRAIPHACLADLVFPWVVAGLEVVESINRVKNKNVEDHAIIFFLDCLMWL